MGGSLDARVSRGKAPAQYVKPPVAPVVQDHAAAVVARRVGNPGPNLDLSSGIEHILDDLFIQRKVLDPESVLGKRSFAVPRDLAEGQLTAASLDHVTSSQAIHCEAIQSDPHGHFALVDREVARSQYRRWKGKFTVSQRV